MLKGCALIIAMLVALCPFLYNSLNKPTAFQVSSKQWNMKSNDQIITMRKSSDNMFKLLQKHNNAFYEEENGILSTDFISPNTYSRQPYVSNGYIGSRIPNVGFGYSLDTLNIWVTNSSIPGALNNGWPLRNQRFAGAFVSDFYSLQEKLNSTNFPEIDKNGYSSVISSIPQWTDLRIVINGTSLSPDIKNLKAVTNYCQSLSMNNGIVITEYDWLDNVHIKCTVLAHRKYHHLGLVSLDVSLINLSDTLDLKIDNILDLKTSHRTVLEDIGHDNDGIFIVVQPDNVPYSNASIYTNWIFENCEEKLNTSLFHTSNETVTQSRFIQLNRNQSTINIKKYTAIISSEYNTKNGISNLNLAKQLVVSSMNEFTFDQLIKIHDDSWCGLYNEVSIQIPSNSLLELAAKSSIYHLLTNVRSHNISRSRGLPVPVSGLSSDSYGGMVFWDSDIWILPAFLPFFPNIAKEIHNYRNQTHLEACKNARLYNYTGAIYPWTSGRFANCTSTGPCINYEYHINIDIALSSFLIYLSGGDENFLRYTTWPIMKDAALFFSEYVQYNNTLDQFVTHNLTDPDEFANFIDNGAFTNTGIKLLLKWAADIGNHLGLEIDPKWLEISSKIHIPISDTNITLEYTGMNSSIEIKQADVMLMVYPLDYVVDEFTLTNAIQNLYYYSEHQSLSGPAMTYPIFVAASAGLLSHGCSSQSYLYKSVIPYLRSPFAQFSEQSDDNFLTNGLTQPAFPFLTANGGFLQSIIFGLTGLRYSYKVNSTTKKIQRYLKFNPISLPLLPGGIRIDNFNYMGQNLSIIIDDHYGTIIHNSINGKPIYLLVRQHSLINDHDLSTLDTISQLCSYDHNRLKESYYILNPGDLFTTHLYQPRLNINSNIVECKRITNLTAGVPGDVALSASDGNNYTHWQSKDKSKPGKLLIDLGSGQVHEIKGGGILWGGRPAKNISISILPCSEKIENFIDGLNNSSFLDLKKNLELENYNMIDDDVKNLFSWYMLDAVDINKQHPELDLPNAKFLPILENYKIHPSERYYSEVYNESKIVLLPSNKTEFQINYTKIENSYLNSNTTLNKSCWNKTRFVIFSIQGSYDDDDDVKGATIKELILN